MKQHRLRSAVVPRACLAVALAIAVHTAAAPAAAAEVPWHRGNFQYVVENKDLKDVLRDFASSQGVMTWISPEVSGTVSGKFATPPQKFLDTLASSYGFVWYYDGTVLRVWGGNEVTSTTLTLSAATTDQVKSALERMSVADRRFPIRYDDKARTLIVSGPPGYVETVSAVVRSVDHSSALHDGTEMRVFPLHYARAADRSVQMDGQSVQIPGMVTLLRGMYTHAAANAGATSFSTAQRRVPSLGERGDTGARNDPGGGGGGGGSGVGLPNNWFGLGGGQAPVRPPLPSGGPIADSTAAPAPAGGDYAGVALTAHSAEQGAGLGPELPYIQADPRINAVVIRDRPERMGDYAALIQQLDSRPQLLQIDATIIEVQDGALRDLGVDWRLHNRHLDLQNGDGKGAAALGYRAPGANPGLGDSADGLTPGGGMLTAVLGDAGRFLMTRVSALEQSNRAKIVSTPKVATLDNVEAIMDQRQRFFVRVAGYQSADLYGLSAGVSLRVLPTVVPDSDARQIRLDVHIEDGQLTSQMVDQIPVISSSQINTEAFVNDGESLLIAGYESNDDENNVSGVPGLSKVPVLGRLFQHRSKQRSSVQRLFLLTPHVVSP
ncbi:type III secretion system outer membrane ring subunit SctC [Xanthomonas graminis]|uniref:type III secretion system outer membrane ring subunit SctC n=1 Tax=Xanthomonas graminis TaxID=3390026 RepID=UPI00029C974A|nr:type III secretion system outer membrane ring subunit SctC [Xanthomonas translucens]EKU26007.1 type III secretory pathway component [Xanthomonas translucens pv. graminis ART-Xtg29]OAX61406.1 EscC/YscC/HrcC family type III secretion system outer membrane ring protein [Xanthomonas translucens pv. graminis]UKE53494.1 type III secretion system outer membrane ring subunit SctC [Xanthomonas translucens pv. graminis]WIH07812.1 type III secretion system outer membrane ring subunit SctC [Xanthomonas 